MNSPLVARSSPLSQIGANLSLEWRRVRDLDLSAEPPGAELLFYVNAPCVVLGRTRKVALDLTDHALSLPPGFLARRRSGGGTVYQDENNLNFSLIIPRAHPALPASPREAAHFLLSAVVDALGGKEKQAAIERISDVTVRGLKVSGNAQYRGRQVLLHHGTLLLKADVQAMVRTLRLPPERPDIPHQFFVTDLETLGYDARIDTWVKTLTGAFSRLLGLQASWDSFPNEWIAEAQDKAAEMTSPEWVRRF